MGQKVNPHGLRVGVIQSWDTQWFANKKDFAKYLKEDNVLRNYIKKKYYTYGIASIGIERSQDKIVINIHTSKPGMLIGTKGAGVEQLKNELYKLVGKKTIHINVLEVKKPDMDATARRRVHRAATRKEKLVQKSYEAGYVPRHQKRSKGCQDQGRRPSRRCRNRKIGKLSRGFHPAADHPRRHRLRRCGSAHHVRYHRRKGMDLQGRSPSLP